MAKKKKQKNKQADSPPQPSSRLKRIFTLIAYSIPILFFVILEGGLRLAGFGHSYPLFIQSPSVPGYHVTNPEIIKRYVPDQSNFPGVTSETVYYRSKKKPDTYRIIVQGGSTAAGFPFGIGASLAGMLQQRLQHTFLDREIEVITTAMSAVNSYTLFDFAGEIINQDPDAILIYAGHNEYLGILGVASSVSIGRYRPIILIYLKLRGLYTFQLLQKIYSALSDPFNNKNNRFASRGTLMARIVGEKHIARGSSLYELGISQFQSNLSALLARYDEEKIPVFIGTLVSNERDQKPFINGLDPQTDELEWNKHYQTGVEALKQGDMKTAIAAIDKAIRLDDNSADAYYAKGQFFEAQENYKEASKAYLAAKDRDQLRFRAPEDFNLVIREIAQQYNATVVEVQNAFIKNAKHEIIGENLILEHVHPTLRGYFIMANAFYEALQRKKLIGSWENAIPSDAARKNIPVTEVERLVGLYKITSLKADWPFQQKKIPFALPTPKNRIEELAIARYKKELSWSELMEQLLIYYQKNGNYEEASKVAVIQAQAFPYSEKRQYNAGKLLMTQNRNKEALFYIKRAVNLAPDKQYNLLALAQAYLLNSQKELSLQALEKLIRIAPNHKLAQRLIRQLEIGQSRQLMKNW